MASDDASEGEVVMAMLDFLNGCSKEAEGAKAEQIAQAMAALTSAFGVDRGDVEQRVQLSYAPASLPEILGAGIESLEAKSIAEQHEDLESNDVFQTFLTTVKNKGVFTDYEEGTPGYLERYCLVVDKFNAKISASGGGSSGNAAAGGGKGAGLSEEARQEKADEAKTRGNTAFQQNDFATAEKAYSEAIELSPEGPSSHIYLCNRAASRCYQGNYDDAVTDCLASIDLNDEYVKAYSRLGYAFFQQKDYPAAIKAYEKAVDLDPANSSNKKALDQARKESKKPASRAAPGGGGGMGGGAGAGGMPDLSALAGMMGGAGGAGGGMPPGGLAGLMKNPAMMQAAQNMMKNPQMMEMAKNMMSDPAKMQQAMNMMGGMGGMGGAGAGAGGGGGGGGGGMPDLSSLMGMMGGAGGGGGGGGGQGMDMSAASDPEVQKLMKIANEEGMDAAIAQASDNPDVLNKLMAAMGNK